MKNTLSTEEKESITIETNLWRKAMFAILMAIPSSGVDSVELDHFRALRDEMAQAKFSDLPGLFTQINRAKTLLSRETDTTLPDPNQPYFAHMRLKIPEGVQDILLGNQTFIDSKNGITIINWRTAPLARIYFTYRQGEEYEEEINDRDLTGRLSLKHAVAFKEGDLKEIYMPSGVLSKNSLSQWEKRDLSPGPILTGGSGTSITGQNIGTGRTDYHSPAITALLDPDQYEALTRDERTPVLILGHAGSGKTTTALHRLAYLSSQRTKAISPDSVLILVPEKGLVKLTCLLLEELGITGAMVSTFNNWVERLARRQIKNLPGRTWKKTPYGITKIKRHPAMLEILPLYLEKVCQDIASRLVRFFPSHQEILQSFVHQAHQPILLRLTSTWETAVLKVNQSNEKARATSIQRINRFFQNEIDSLFDHNADRLDLFADKQLMSKLIHLTHQKPAEEWVDMITRYTNQQHLPTNSETYDGYDKDKLMTIAGESILAEESESLAGSIDREDFAILLELARLKTGSMESPENPFPTYSSIILDESQELAPIELSLISTAIGKNSVVTIAGDDAQQTDPSAYFESWPDTLKWLGIKKTAYVELKTNYRSTQSIADFAHDILGPIAPGNRPLVKKSGAPVSLDTFANEAFAISTLIEVLEGLIRKEPLASVAIITRERKTAQTLVQHVRNVLNVRWIVDGEFQFTPGIDITDVSQVKGLEFDYVIIPDGNATDYPDTFESRRKLHVACTRAIHQLWVYWIGRRSPLIDSGR